MAKVIIGIHGLGNKPPKETLENWWRSAMLEGLEKHKNLMDLPTFELVYWADILHDKPLDDTITNKEDPYFMDERYTPGLAEFKPEENSLRQKVLDFMEDQLDKLFLNQDLTVNYSKITDLIIKTYFKDLEVYYAKECLNEKYERCKARTLIIERLVAVLKKYQCDEIMLVAHSMGSIIAYDVLTFIVPDIDIHTFVTIGSPLGFPVIQGKIASEWQSRRLVTPKLTTPPGVKKHWYNLADLNDRIALIYNLGKNFNANYRKVSAEDFVVFNDYQNNHSSNPHKSYGYLRTKEFANVLIRFYPQGRGFFKRLLTLFKSINSF